MGHIIAFSGTHGVGKTDAASRMVVDLKRAHPDKSIKSLCDLEHECPYPINGDATRESQLWIFVNRIQEELDKLSRFDILVTDRSVVDVAAYTYVAGFEDLAMGMLPLAGQHISIYKEIHFKSIAHNNFWFDDGIRDAKDKRYKIGRAHV